MEKLPLRNLEPEPEQAYSAVCIVCEDEFDYDDMRTLDKNDLEHQQICIWCIDNISKAGWTMMPSGYKRWICNSCGEVNAGNKSGFEECQQCHKLHFINNFNEQRWSIRPEV